jgi:hypothetical protein
MTSNSIHAVEIVEKDLERRILLYRYSLDWSGSGLQALLDTQERRKREGAYRATLETLENLYRSSPGQRSSEEIKQRLRAYRLIRTYDEFMRRT